MKNPTSFHRYALWVLVVCLAAAAGCGQTPVDQLDLTTLLPGEPAWLMAADIPVLRQSDVWQELQGLELGLPGVNVDLELFLEDAGIDPEQDLGRLQGALYPRGAPEGGFVAVLIGRFNRETLLPELEKKGFFAETHRKLTLIRPPARNGEGTGAPIHCRWYVVYLDDTAIGLADTREGATGLIDRRLDSGESLELHPGFGPLLAEVDRTAPLWGAGLLSEDAMSGLEAELPVQGMIPSLSNLAFSVRLETGPQLACLTMLPTDEEAARLAGQLNGWVKLAAGLIQTNPQWFEKEPDRGDDTLKLVAETLDQVVVSAGGATVRLEGEIPTELLRRAMRSAPHPLHSP